VPVLADVRSAARVAEVFELFRPQVVFHAAAYKQVPLVEAHPVEGAAVNVLGTKRLVDAAERAGVGRFVLFSTDKAVEPASVLGRTKAVAEWTVAAAGEDLRTAAVRLGNVVDSAGSILPRFRRQLARGGPVTVTHPEMTRYLMTAGEAAGLAIVAGALADTTVSWLDVGPPVHVVDLVRRLAPDVEIELVGLRPGERLHEQPFRSGDEIVATHFAHVVAAPLHRVDRRWLDGRLAVLAHHVERASAAGVRAALAELLGAPALEAEVRGAAVAR
jgi:FlaA1/EpsC-like NDP-sugar epimerase